MKKLSYKLLSHMTAVFSPHLWSRRLDREVIHTYSHLKADRRRSVSLSHQ